MGRGEEAEAGEETEEGAEGGGVEGLVYAARPRDGEDFVAGAAEYGGVVVFVAGRRWWGGDGEGRGGGEAALEVDGF